MVNMQYNKIQKGILSGCKYCEWLCSTVFISAVYWDWMGYSFVSFSVPEENTQLHIWIVIETDIWTKFIKKIIKVNVIQHIRLGFK